jgi:hypothetical protein
VEQRELVAACCRIRSSGTGFLVARDRVATCWHAVKDLEVGAEVPLVFSGGQARAGRLLAVDARDDGAVIAIEPLPDVEPLPLAEAYDGRDEWEGCGYPDEASGNALPLSGVVEAPQWKYGGRDALVLRCNQAGGAPVVGWSGSPVVVRDAVVGFVHGYCRDTASADRPAFGDLIATPAWVIRRLLPDLPPAPGPLYGYLRDLERTTSWIDLQGISSGAGESRAATRSRIETMYTPLRARGPFGGRHGLEPEMEARETRLTDLLPHHPRLLFVGAPGSGKTTFLRLVACMLARDALHQRGPGGRPWRGVHLGLPETGRAPVPIFVRLSELARALEACAERDVQAGEILHAVAPDTDRARREPERRAMERALVDGDAVLLLDGLDEVTGEEARRRVMTVIEDARARWRSASIVATSRPFETKRLTERGLDFQEAFVEPFERAEISAFLDRWVRALPGVESGYRAELEDTIVHREEIRRLAENPVLLTCLCVVHWNERRLPSGRAAAYRAVIKWLLLARKEQRMAAGYPQGFAERAFPELALHMMMRPSGKAVSIGFADAAQAVEAVARKYRGQLRGGEDPRRAAEEWLRWECTGSGVVQQIGHGTVRFWHLTFQEFLAAERLADWDGSEKGPKAWWPVIVPRLDDPQWAVMLDLFPACLLPKGDERVDTLLERVRTLGAPNPTLAGEARVVARLHRMLTQLEAYEYPVPEATETAYRALLERVRRIFDPDGVREVPWKDRLAAAEALGSAGDFRLEISPLGRMIEVRPGLALGKYPVTVQEYQVFVEAGGYREHRFWDDEGWTRRKEWPWEAPDGWDQQVGLRNRPVVGVSWFEAAAYCAWLAEKTGQPIRLPAEAE